MVTCKRDPNTLYSTTCRQTQLPCFSQQVHKLCLLQREEVATFPTSAMHNSVQHQHYTNRREEMKECRVNLCTRCNSPHQPPRYLLNRF